MMSSSRFEPPLLVNMQHLFFLSFKFLSSALNSTIDGTVRIFPPTLCRLGFDLTSIELHPWPATFWRTLYQLSYCAAASRWQLLMFLLPQLGRLPQGWEDLWHDRSGSALVVWRHLWKLPFATVRRSSKVTFITISLLNWWRSLTFKLSPKDL